MRSMQGRWKLSVLCALTILLIMPALVGAQDYRGKVQGVVMDSGKAALANAKVVLRNEGTGVEVTHQTNTDGHYIFDFVESGNYSLRVEVQGFKKFEQRNIEVRNRADLTVDARLEVGGLSEVITVQDSPVGVKFNTSSDILTIDNKLIDQMPIRGRNPYNVTTLDPTVNAGNNAENRPYHHAFASEFDAGGGTFRANDIQLDGVPLTSSYKTSYTPSMEAVAEVSFQKNAVDSEYGYSSGGIVILNMKSGTNNFHGSGYYHRRDPKLNAFGDPTLPRTPGMDETGLRGTSLRMYGGTIGGPIIKKKLFFFSSFEHWDDARPLTVKLTLPTALERQGDFSQSVRTCLINQVSTPCVREIYDPITATGPNGIRQRFDGMKIPRDRFDPTAVRLLAEMPLPNLPGNDLNWQGTKVENVDYWNLSNRIDWNISEKWKSFVRYGQFRTHLLEDAPAEGKLFPITGSNRYGLSIAADTVYTINARMVLNLRANYHRLTDEASVPTAILGQEGLQNLWPNNPWYSSLYTSDTVYYPAIDMNAGSSTYRLGRTGREFWQHPQGWGGSARLNWYAGDHAIKFGGEVRVDKGKGARFEPINLTFRQLLTANQQSGSDTAVVNGAPDLNNTGSEWATFLLGYLDNGSAARRVPVQEVNTFGYSAYVHDDFKVNNRLTLNLGLRWEFEPGPVDAQNRLSQRLDLTNPIPEFQATPPVMPAEATQLLAGKGYRHIYNGAWIFTDENNRRAWSRSMLNLLPRVGLALRLDQKSVFRFGYARYMTPSSKIRDPLGDFVNQYTGYSTVTTAIATDRGNPRSVLADPFPSTGPTSNPVQLPTEQSLGRYTNLGNAVSLDQYELKPQLNDRFTASYQREVRGRLVFSFDFFYNHGTNVPYSVDLNMADPSFLYELPNTITNRTVTNPFRGYLTPDKFPGALRTTPQTVSIGSLLRPYPQYGAITQTNTAGKKLHVQSYKFQVQRPFFKGLSMLVNYAYQREAQTEFFDDRATYARDFQWRFLSSPRHRFNHAVTWELPVGRGRWLLRTASTPLDLALGGWQLTTTNRWFSGNLLQFTQNLIVTGNPKLDHPTRDRWFDTSVFRRLPASDRSVPRTNAYNYPGLVGPGASQVDMTMSKSFKLNERFKLEVRME
ncbi:MAG TPA: carboxypeptidase-like regulatory domain-containing protein, partial [Blastocatellia bacterium]|nr:carboxypeptidase-like regulatory domain-containing protein [Blastocatellia bacterium]